MSPAARLRPATAADEPFFEALLAAVRPELAALPAPVAAPLIGLQLRAQRADWGGRHGELAESVILTPGGEPAGRLVLARDRAAITVLDIAVLPARQGAGLGTAVLTALQREARAGGLELRLSAERGGRAAALYRRLGFAPAGEGDELREPLAWRPQENTAS